MSGAGLPDVSVPDSTGVTVGLVTSHWNEEITGQLRREALAQAEEVGAVVTDVTVVGALEIPVVVQQLARTHDAVVALGCVIRGGTPHFDYVCDSVTEGLTRIALDCETPVGNGVLTCNTVHHAIDRAGGEGAVENKGREAIDESLHTVALFKYLREGGAE